MYHLSNVSGLRSSPLPVNFLGEGTLIVTLGKGSSIWAGAGAESLAPPPWSEISSELLLLLLELSGSPAGSTTGALLDDSFRGDSGNPLGVTVAAFASSVADSARSRYALSLASCLAASSIENCCFANFLRNCPYSSLAHFG